MQESSPHLIKFIPTLLLLHCIIKEDRWKKGREMDCWNDLGESFEGGIWLKKAPRVTNKSCSFSQESWDSLMDSNAFYFCLPLYFLRKLRSREKRQLLKIRQKWVCCKKLICAVYSDEGSQAAQRGILIGAALRNAARERPGGRGWEGLREKAQWREKGIWIQPRLRNQISAWKQTCRTI